MTSKTSNQDRFTEVPLTFHKVKVLPAKKDSPFQAFIDFQGLEIDVEFPAGSTRKGTSPEGEAWEAPMFAHYGEIRGTKGVDGDNLDVYVGDNHDSSLVVVIHQHKPGEGYDEDKVILGCSSVEEAIGLYKRHYPKPGFYVGEYKALPIGAFWRWVHDPDKQGQRIARRQEGLLREGKMVQRIAARHLQAARERAAMTQFGDAQRTGGAGDEAPLSALELIQPLFQALYAANPLAVSMPKGDAQKASLVSALNNGGWGDQRIYTVSRAKRGYRVTEAAYPEGRPIFYGYNKVYTNPVPIIEAHAKDRAKRVRKADEITNTRKDAAEAVSKEIRKLWGVNPVEGYQMGKSILHLTGPPFEGVFAGRGFLIEPMESLLGDYRVVWPDFSDRDAGNDQVFLDVKDLKSRLLEHVAALKAQWDKVTTAQQEYRRREEKWRKEEERRKEEAALRRKQEPPDIPYILRKLGKTRLLKNARAGDPIFEWELFPFNSSRLDTYDWDEDEWRADGVDALEEEIEKRLFDAFERRGLFRIETEDKGFVTIYTTREGTRYFKEDWEP